MNPEPVDWPNNKYTIYNGSTLQFDGKSIFDIYYISENMFMDCVYLCNSKILPMLPSRPDQECVAEKQQQKSLTHRTTKQLSVLVSEILLIHTDVCTRFGQESDGRTMEHGMVEDSYRFYLCVMSYCIIIIAIVIISGIENHYYYY